MRTLISILFSLLCIGSAQALELSSCDQGCFQTKQRCNDKKSHTFNSCDHELLACKASCTSGKPQEFHRKSPPFEMAFNPTFEFKDKL